MDNTVVKFIFLLSLTKTYMRNNPHYTLLWLFARYARLRYDTITNKNCEIKSISDEIIENLVKRSIVKSTSYTDFKCCALGNVEGATSISTPKWYYVCSKISCRKYKLLVVHCDDCKTDQIIVSDTMLFNMETALRHKLQEKSYFVMPAGEKTLPCAAEARISMISNPYDCSNNLIDSLLETYFNTPRYSKAKEIFGINLKEYAPQYFYTSFSPSLRKVYFRVNSLRVKYNDSVSSTSNGCYIVKGETSLIQESNIHSYLPCEFAEPIDFTAELPVNYKIQLEIIENYPPSLEKPLRSLQACLSPFLQKESEMKINPVFLVKGTPGSGKFKLVRSLAKRNGLNFLNVDFADVQSLLAPQTEAKLRIVFQNARNSVPCILKLSNIQIFGKNSEGQKDERIISAFRAELNKLNEKSWQYPVIVVATSESDELDANIERLFIETICIDHPDRLQKSETLSWLLKTRGLFHNADLTKIADFVTDFGLSDLEALIMHAAMIAYQSLPNETPDAISLTLVQNDFIKACELMQSSYSDRVGAPRIPKVYWEDIGGLAKLKHEIKRRIELPMLNAMGLGRSGLLLYGPPGTGKTLLAKAVATECQLHFMSVKGPELLNMYVGQSEKNIRQVFERARAAAPCVIFFDELDSLAPNRGRSGDSGGVMDRVVSQLLAEMDGLETSGTIFIIGATNRPDLIDPALLRPGRFDKMLYVGICADRDSQLSVLKAVTRRFKMKNNGKELEEIVQELPANLTGADLYALCSDAWLLAVRRSLLAVQQISDTVTSDALLKKTYNDGIIVELRDFVDAARNLVPSVGDEELSRYEKLEKELSSSR